MRASRNIFYQKFKNEMIIPSKENMAFIFERPVQKKTRFTEKIPAGRLILKVFARRTTPIRSKIGKNRPNLKKTPKKLSVKVLSVLINKN